MTYRKKKLEKNKDAFGWALYDFLKSENNYVIIERDDGFIEAENTEKYFSEFDIWPEHMKKAMKFVIGKVLDIGCGAGRHVLWLQRKGIDVLGIDKSPMAVRVCKLRGAKNVKVISIEKIDKLSPRLFNTILMMGNNFGLFGSFNKAKVLLKKIYKITYNDSRIIAELLDPYKTKLKEHLSYQKFNRKRGRMSGQVRLRMIYKKYKGDWFDYLFVSEKELREILKGTGWFVEKILKSSTPVYAAVIKKIN